MIRVGINPNHRLSKHYHGVKRKSLKKDVDFMSKRA